ncbi:sensor histidine kinase [Nocardioides sp. Soil796]|uniref:sensor histidine kinase n=1 Tax=Nocardioides sp. Soil796 TaxID=1736412 RepID=UPI00070D9931|nr:HAMP domain-containing sensor histidine kinase [Nocardioides sp. Soil796]KRF12725.1 hypothetical protein ASH02_14385 [Nocardioides sp. Soil796]
MMRWRSLTWRLVGIAVLLVAVTSILIATATTLAMRANLNAQLDKEIRTTLDRVSDAPRVPAGQTAGPLPDGERIGPPLGTITLQGTEAGWTRGTVVVEVNGATFGAAVTLSDEQLAAFADITDDSPETLNVPDLPRYRVLAKTTRDGERVLVGMTTEEVDGTLSDLVQWEMLATVLGVLLAATAGSFVVRRQLQPLNDVADTAHRVAEQPLASGEIDLTDRVPEHLTDERTEVGRVGAALNTLLAHVESSLDARHRSEQQVRQFVGDASHELRTPLATIKGYAELARRRPDDAAGVLAALDKVEAESGRMTTLVEDLLLLARLDSGRPLDSAPVDLTRLLLEAVADARVLSPTHQWRLDLPAESVTVLGDEQRLHQVVTNLLTNARKYTPADTTVTARARPGEITIMDDGPGFAPELADTAFERFVRGDEARNRAGGVGLGLSLVKAIMEAHGGTVELSSRPGETRFTLRFPTHR